MRDDDADKATELARLHTVAVDLPVTADLESGYGDAGETIRWAVLAAVMGGGGLPEGTRKRH